MRRTRASACLLSATIVGSMLATVLSPGAPAAAAPAPARLAAADAPPSPDGLVAYYPFANGSGPGGAPPGPGRGGGGRPPAVAGRPGRVLPVREGLGPGGGQLRRRSGRDGAGRSVASGRLRPAGVEPRVLPAAGRRGRSPVVAGGA